MKNFRILQKMSVSKTIDKVSVIIVNQTTLPQHQRQSSLIKRLPPPFLINPLNAAPHPVVRHRIVLLPRRLAPLRPRLQGRLHHLDRTVNPQSREPTRAPRHEHVPHPVWVLGRHPVYLPVVVEQPHAVAVDAEEHRVERSRADQRKEQALVEAPDALVLVSLGDGRQEPGVEGLLADLDGVGWVAHEETRCAFGENRRVFRVALQVVRRRPH